MEKKTKKAMGRDFILVVIGQIISLLGNAVLRFALPLHLLHITNSPAVFGGIVALSFLPMFLMSPLGGAAADRLNKKNIMACLDFFTAAMLLVFLLVYDSVSLVAAILVVMIFLYGISGFYQPSVQASIPVLVEKEKMVSANAVINLVSSLSGLLGPVLGGICYSVGGLFPILVFSVLCFFCSAVMELFIHMPVSSQKTEKGILGTVLGDLKESVCFIGKEQKFIGKLTVVLAFFNLVLSALQIIGTPVLVTQVLVFHSADPDRLLGYTEGALALGGIAGGILSAVFGEKFSIAKSWKFLMGACLLLLPTAVALKSGISGELQYLVLTASCFLIMVLSSMFTVGLMAHIQQITPETLVGKVIAWIYAICTCSQPVGQAMYGVLFETLKGQEWVIFLLAAAGAGAVALVFRQSVKAYEKTLRRQELYSF